MSNEKVINGPLTYTEESYPASPLIGGMLIGGAVIHGEIGQEVIFEVFASGTAIEFEQNVVTNAAGIAVEVEQSTVTSATGVAVEVEQLIGVLASGIAIEFEQEIVLVAQASGVAIEFDQQIQASGSGIAVEFRQRVRDVNRDATHAERWGWDAEVIVDGSPIPKCNIGGQIIVNKTENAATLAEVTLINISGVQTFVNYHGKSLLINVETASGIERLFTGLIDDPVVDLVNKRVKLKCTDNREERISEEYAAQVRTIGVISDAIYDPAETIADELKQRLETTPYAVDIDNNGVIRKTSILSKGNPNYTLDACDITQSEVPTVQLGLRARLTNEVNMEFEARWVRLRQRERTFRIETPTFWDYMTVLGLDYLRIDTVYATAVSFPWAVKPGSFSFTYLPDAGVYNCGNGPFIWTPPRGFGSVVYVRDENGNIVKDVNGKEVTEFQSGSSRPPIFCLTAQFDAAKRWAQDISEVINIRLYSSQSIGQYGVVAKAQRNGYEVEYDSSDFESEDIYQSPQGFIAGENANFYIDKTGEVEDYLAAINCAFEIARNKIVRSHRNNEVSFKARNFTPKYDLWQTLIINTNSIYCRGKVKSVSHVLDCQTKNATTKVTLALSRVEGAPVSDSLSFPLLAAPLLGTDSASIITQKLYSKKGGSYPTPPLKNTTITAPAIEPMARQRQTTTRNFDFNVSIQNDPLEVNF